MATSISPSVAQYIAQSASVLAQAGHGNKGELVSEICAATGQSRATVYRQLNKLSVRPKRKQRKDTGKTSVTLHEAQLLSAVLMESHRKNDKQLMTVGRALEVLRHSGDVLCSKVDATTGEIQHLAAGTVERALRMYRLHPEQLLRPAPCVELRSAHPNHVWQIDASLCVLYYLRASAGGGLQVLDADKFYKNKPKALERIENERVWRYVVTDHYSGAIFINYVLGAESSKNLAESFTAAIQPRDGDVLYGVPYILMMDMGSANTSGLFKNLARRLQVKLWAHMPGNARATGQVEKAQDIVERGYESALKYQPVDSLQQLNNNARMWVRHFNATAIHSRYKGNRATMWGNITQEQLRIAPSIDLCRELMTHEPQERKVTTTMTVKFNGHEYDVSNIPHVAVGEKLQVALNAYAQDNSSICIVDVGADGNEMLHQAPVLLRDEAGFRDDANMIGEDFKAHAETQLQANLKLIDQIATETTTDADAAAARKAKVAPFGGRIDPLKQARETKLPTPLPKRGKDLEVATQTTSNTPERLLSHFEVAKELAAAGVALDADKHTLIKRWYPDGVPEAEVAGLPERLTKHQYSPLRIVGGTN